MFAGFAWGVLAYNVGVVLWGAYVRATSSGAGCGGHWPLCNGDVVPRAASAATIIEYTHRLSSGVAFFSVLALYLAARRIFARREGARTAAGWSLILMVVEALLGAGLVIFGFTNRDASAGRAVSIALHLVNTQALLWALAMTAWLARRPAARLWPARAPGILFAGAGLVLAVSVTGAIAALGDTLFPAVSVRAGIQQDLAATAHFLLRLRTIHPPLAVLTAFLLLVAASSAAKAAPVPEVKRGAAALAAFTLLQIFAGAVNIALLAPVWMQLVHLLVADLVWIVLVILTASASVAATQRVPATRTARAR